MRTLILISMVFSLSAFAQTRVRENIKQQSIITADGTSQVIKKVVAKPQPAPAPVKSQNQ
jgi:CBS domain containing-hemolysin-like protein